MKTFTHYETESVKFLQPFFVVATDSLFEIETVVISAVLLLQTNTPCVPTFCYWSVRVLLSSIIPCQDVHWQMFHEQKEIISVRSNIRESTQVLLVNTSPLHLHNFFSAGVSTGLATRLALTGCHGVLWKSPLYGDIPASDFSFIP
jgi:hypothetical protein